MENSIPLWVARAGAAMLPLALSSAALGAGPAAKVHTVVIDKMKFGPVPTGLRVGDTILWVNKDMFRHTATARDKSFNVDVAPGGRASTKLGRAGNIPFYCIYHPGMTGRLAVAQ